MDNVEVFEPKEKVTRRKNLSKTPVDNCAYIAAALQMTRIPDEEKTFIGAAISMCSDMQAGEYRKIALRYKELLEISKSPEFTEDNIVELMAIFNAFSHFVNNPSLYKK